VSRIIGWFSCGAASAVAIKAAIQHMAKRQNPMPLEIVRCWVAEEDEDNDRFAADCERWFGMPIKVLMAEKYCGSIYKVFEKTKYISGVAGAPCTRELKKEVRIAYQQPDDIHIFGYTKEESHRWDQLYDANNGIKTWDILGELGLSHDDCLAIVDRAGIKLPNQYLRGFDHNNCKTCVKATSPDYWKMVRFHHPIEFRRMADATRPGAITKNGCKLVRIKGERYHLDELPEGDGNPKNQGTIQCGIFCELAEKEMEVG